MEKNSKQINKRFLELFYEVKLRNGMSSNEELAKPLGLYFNHFSSYEKGARNIPTKAVQKFRELYGVSSEYILFGNGPRYENQKPTNITSASPQNTKPELEERINRIERELKLEQKIDQLRITLSEQITQLSVRMETIINNKLEDISLQIQLKGKKVPTERVNPLAKLHAKKK